MGDQATEGEAHHAEARPSPDLPSHAARLSDLLRSSERREQRHRRWISVSPRPTTLGTGGWTCMSPRPIGRWRVRRRPYRGLLSTLFRRRPWRIIASTSVKLALAIAWARGERGALSTCQILCFPSEKPYRWHGSGMAFGKRTSARPWDVRSRDQRSPTSKRGASAQANDFGCSCVPLCPSGEPSSPNRSALRVAGSKGLPPMAALRTSRNVPLHRIGHSEDPSLSSLSSSATSSGTRNPLRR